MDKIVVAGGGTMGAGIAFVAGKAGFEVDLIEPDAAARERAKARIAADAERAKVPVPHINYCESVIPGTQAVAAIEAVPERLDLKRGLFRTLASALGPDALLATNTSSLSVTEIAEGIERPERVAGLHFFNPPALMKLVEIVYTGETSDETIGRARELVAQMEKIAVLAADTPGFIVNRVARPFYLQALRAYQAGAAPIEDLDRLARGAGFRMGPFELMDLIGLDVNLATSESIFERTGAERFEPLQLQRDMVAQNRLGRKTGAGFYDYANGPPVRDDAAPPPADSMNTDEKIAVIGSGGLALELQSRLSAAYANVELWEDEDALDEIPLDTTIAVDVGDGASDRAHAIEVLDSVLPQEAVIFADAYATDVKAAAARMQFPERLVGYGILASLERQHVVEIADTDEAGDDALALAQELFESIGRRVALIQESGALFLGRTVGSIVNEAVYVIEEETASPDDVDLAMQLGTNYPQGPVAWGREIGGDRLKRILQRLAREDGAAFAPHRALWVLDVQNPEEESTGENAEGVAFGAQP